ncbi:Com family DNA-binding transcriptional regulator [uncultured Pseudomonas sp.]|uniref:Com family DNA-binding transcriptional regulator n=1 Tax=uncultured Pseudomonas sp. TaxID=114707 RepID=UPI0030DC6177
MKTELRCGHCGRKLAEATGPYNLIMKCPRCRGMNHLKALSLVKSPLSAQPSEVSNATSSTHR